MAVNATRVIGIGLTGDVNAPNLAYSAAPNAASPGMVQNIALTTGANTITVPSGATAVTIVPPTANTVTMQLKGVTGDTGIRLHLTDPSSISLTIASTASFCITVSGALTLRFIWT